MPLSRAIQLIPKAPVDPEQSLSVLIVSEGFQATEQDAFIDSCYALINRLLAHFPFSLIQVSPHPIAFYYSFLSSTQHGPDTSSTPPSNRTAFDSQLDPNSGELVLNDDKVKANLESIGLPGLNSNLVPVSDLVPTGSIIPNRQGVEVLVLLPEVTAPTTGADAHYGSEEAPSNVYHYTATTLNGEWHQVLARRFASRFGLSDEFERTGSDHLAPSDKQAAHLNVAAPNLIATSDPSRLPDLASKWSAYLSTTVRSQLQVHPHSGDPSVANDTPLSEFPYVPPTGFWEGGGGFRTGVYRPASDCLMRRQIGSQSLSCRTGHVDFCPVCAQHVRYHLIPR
jgi:hypothetical protein